LKARHQIIDNISFNIYTDFQKDPNFFFYDFLKEIWTFSMAAVTLTLEI
jgi:hypothetical protein